MIEERLNRRMTSDFFQAGIKAYQEMFWPDFIEHDGCVFLAFNRNAYQQWHRQTGGDRRKIESLMNHRHVVDLLPKAVESPTRGLVILFGQLLRDVWDAKLRRDFPTRKFCVSFPPEERIDLTDYEITFYQL
jgi:predicted oxidoreductase (fatty acid repression mutant protein)